MSKLSKLAKDLRGAKLTKRQGLMLKGGTDKRGGVAGKVGTTETTANTYSLDDDKRGISGGSKGSLWP